MRLKKSKEEVMQDIKWDVVTRISNTINGYTYNGQINLNGILDAIKYSVAEGVEQGIRTLLENEYTDDDFDRDLTLK